MGKKISFLAVFFLIIAGFFYYLKIDLKVKLDNKVSHLSQKTEDFKEAIIPKPTKIEANGLPDKHLIKMAFIPQAPEKNWDQPWQDACEEAALLTVDYYYRHQTPDTLQIKSDILKMMEFEKSQGWTKDINTLQMTVVSGKYLGYQSKVINNPTLEEIKSYLAQDIPIIVPADGKILFRENHYFRSGGPYYHNLVIIGYDDNSGKFTVHDVGTQFGAYFRYTYETLMESNHDFPQTGQKEDIENEAKRMLVLLK